MINVSAMSAAKTFLSLFVYFYTLFRFKFCLFNEKLFFYYLSVSSFVANDLVMNVLCERVGFAPITNEPKQRVCVKYRNAIYCAHFQSHDRFFISHGLIHIHMFSFHIECIQLKCELMMFGMRHTENNFGNIWKHFLSIYCKIHRHLDRAKM